MKLELIRTYYTGGTNGELFLNRKKVCSTIELPWKNNRSQISCIPEGEYELIKRYSPKYKWHLHLQHVPGRELILIHPGNDAMKELKGCIAPVLKSISPGAGVKSRLAFKKVYDLLTPLLANNKQIYIIIKSNSHVSLDTSLS